MCKIISIIVPVFNVERYIGRCLKSIASQLSDGLEVILIDDGSTDNSIKIVREFIGPYGDAFTLISQENSGLSAARNTGIAAATGRYLLFLDSDDFLASDGLVNILDSLRNSQPDILIGRYELSLEPGAKEFPISANLDALFSSPYSMNKLLEVYIEQKIFATMAPLFIVDRCFLRNHEIEFIDNIIHEDEAYCPTILSLAESVAYLSKPFYVYCRRSAGSITSDFSEQYKYKKMNSYFKILDSLIERMMRFEGNSLRRRFLLMHIELYVISQLLNFPKETRLYFAKLSLRAETKAQLRFILKEGTSVWIKAYRYFGFLGLSVLFHTWQLLKKISRFKTKY